jgi:hypothetical protein
MPIVLPCKLASLQCKIEFIVATADLRQNIAIINKLQVTSQEQMVELEASRQQVLQLQIQAQNKAAIIDSLKERVVLLETNSNSDVDEIDKLTAIIKPSTLKAMAVYLTWSVK